MRLVLNNIKSGVVPLIFIPGSSYDNVLPHIATTINSNYGLSYEVMFWAIDNMLRQKLNMNTSQYVRNRLFDHMDMKDTYFIYQDNIPDSVFDRFPEPAVRRTIATSSYVPGTTNLTQPSTGCDRRIIDNKLQDKLLWASEVPDDGLVKAMYIKDRNPNDIPAGGLLLLTTLNDYNKILKLIINGGVYNGKRLVGQQTMNWTLQPKINGLSDVWTFYGTVQVDGGSSDTAGAYRINRDIVTRNDFPLTDNVFHVGGSGGSYTAYDTNTGYYVTIYSAFFYCNSYVTKDGVNVSYRNLATVSKLLGLIAKTP